LDGVQVITCRRFSALLLAEEQDGTG
jgi:hypothetical protein